jgi:hypothetical protein
MGSTQRFERTRKSECAVKRAQQTAPLAAPGFRWLDELSRILNVAMSILLRYDLLPRMNFLFDVNHGISSPDGSPSSLHSEE